MDQDRVGCGYPVATKTAGLFSVSEAAFQDPSTCNTP